MRRALVVLLAVAAAPAAPAAASNSDAVNAVRAFNPNNPSTYERLEQVIDAGDVDVAVLKNDLRSDSLNRRWAAAYIGHNLAATPADLGALEPSLRDNNQSVRAMAAFALAYNGRKQALPVLIDLLTSRRWFLHMEPAVPVATAVDERLVAVTKADFGFSFYASASKRAQAVRKWREWWRDVRETISWDRAAERYRWRRAGASAVTPAPARNRATAPSATPAQSEGTGSYGVVANNTATITVKVEFNGPGAESAAEQQRIRDAVDGAESFLNGGGRTGKCVEVNFQIEISFGANTPGYHQIRVAGFFNRDGIRRSYVNWPDGNTRPPNRGETTTGGWQTGDFRGPHAGAFVAHEVGHLMGAPDEYRDTPQGSIPNDPESFLGDHRSGKVRQRHLDDIVDRMLPPGALDCQLWELYFGEWTADLEYYEMQIDANTKRHFIGLYATALVRGMFWVNPQTNAVLPAGSLACGGPYAEERRCPEAEGDSVAKKAIANKGNARCAVASLKHLVERWETPVSGLRTADSFRLKLNVGDRQRTRHLCSPPAQPPAGTRSLIRDSMAGAGALDFTIAIPEQGQTAQRRFDYRPDSHRRAYGTARLTRLG